jgi:hypothetical protein
LLVAVCRGGCSRDVQIALNPDELAEQLNDPEGLKERYDKEMEVRIAPLYGIDHPRNRS